MKFLMVEMRMVLKRLAKLTLINMLMSLVLPKVHILLLYLKHQPTITQAVQILTHYKQGKKIS